VKTGIQRQIIEKKRGFLLEFIPVKTGARMARKFRSTLLETPESGFYGNQIYTE
jgi:hypothetical protein